MLWTKISVEVEIWVSNVDLETKPLFRDQEGTGVHRVLSYCMNQWRTNLFPAVPAV